MQNQDCVEFFLGCKTEQGFMSLFSQLQNPAEIRRTYIMKGGPGSGKSTLMRRLGEDMAARGHAVEWIPCASDANSLDAVIDHTTRIAILDGTAPHIVDPNHPGAVETVVNAAQAWDEAALAAHREEIISLTRQIGFCHSRAGAYIQAAGTLLSHNRLVAADYVDQKAVGHWSDLISNRLKPGAGGEQERLLSAVCVGELKLFDGTLRALCDAVFTVTDEGGAAAPQLLSRLRERALERGTGVITCYCSVHGKRKIDHLIFPDDRVAVCTVNEFLVIDHPNTALVETLTKPLPEDLRAPLTQARHLAGELLAQAQTLVAQAKTLHDELEHFYVSAMDFAKMDDLYETLSAAFSNASAAP